MWPDVVFPVLFIVDEIDICKLVVCIRGGDSKCLSLLPILIPEVIVKLPIYLTLQSIKMTLSEASVDKVGDRWTDDSRGEVKIFLAAVPIDNFLFLVDKREELGLIVWI